MFLLLPNGRDLLTKIRFMTFFPDLFAHVQQRRVGAEGHEERAEVA